MQKRGQVTIFIIAGILIAAALILAALYSQDIVSIGIERPQIEAQAELPIEQEIVQALQNCIDEKTAEAVELAGIQGGYITIPEDPIQPGPNNPFSNALTVVGSMRVPYWKYEAANGVWKAQMPTTVLIQEQLSDYVEKEVAKCAPEVAANYDVSASTDEISVQTTVKDNRVVFTIDYPTVIESESIKAVTREAVSIVEVPFGKLLSNAKSIAESEETFLEDRTIDFLVLYEELPYSGTEFSCATKLWTKPKVIEDFKLIAAENIPNMRLTGSANKAENKYFNWDAVSAGNLRGNFFYSTNWPTQVEIEPSQGELLVGDELNQEIGNEAAAYLSSLFCLTNYHFIYNIKYPVLVSLTDTKTGFTLQYAAQVVIKSNQPQENKVKLDDISLEAEVCKDKQALATVNIMQTLPDRSLEPVEGVDVKYKCLNTVCPIGETDAKGELTSEFPMCYNGFVIASKEGLLTTKEIFSTNQENEITLMMDPLKTLQLEIKVAEGGQERDLRSDEQAVIQITEANKDYITSASQEQTTIELVPGTYQVKSTLIQSGGLDIQIPKETVEHCLEEPIPILGLLGFSRTRCTTTEIPASSLPQVIKGGATSEWELDRAELGSATRVTFYVPAQETPSSYDELTEVYNKIETATAKEPVLE